MTYLERKVLALIEYVRGNPRLEFFDAQLVAEDALDLISRLSKEHKQILLNHCADLLSVFPAVKKHLVGSFAALFQKYEDELLALQVQVIRMKREGTFS